MLDQLNKLIRYLESLMQIFKFLNKILRPSNLQCEIKILVIFGE